MSEELICGNIWDLVATTLPDLLNVKVINRDLLTPTKEQNPHSIAPSCRCISFAKEIPNLDELELQQEVAAMQNCFVGGKVS